MWTDAHCHLSDPRIFAQVPEIVSACETAGITRFVLGGVSPEDWQRQKELVKRYPGRFVPVFGLHPWWVDDLVTETANITEREARLAEALRALEVELGARHACAVGEAGLDGSRGRMKRSRVEQERVFRAQLRMAVNENFPVVLHVVRAHAEALAILSEKSHEGVSGMVHSFSGTREQARCYLGLGWSLSFSSRITFEQSSELREVLKECPSERIFLETDAPDQPPANHCEATHTPQSLVMVAECAGRVRGENAHAILQRSHDNACRMFGPN